MSYVQPAEPVRKRGRWRTMTVIAVLMVAWWVAVESMAVQFLASTGEASPGVATVAASGPVLHVHLPGLRTDLGGFPVATERSAFDRAQRGYADANEALIDAAMADTPWITVQHGDAVQVVRRDGDAVQVELVDGPYAGWRGWLTARQLAP